MLSGLLTMPLSSAVMQPRQPFSTGESSSASGVLQDIIFGNRFLGPSTECDGLLTKLPSQNQLLVWDRMGLQIADGLNGHGIGHVTGTSGARLDIRD